MNEVIGEITQVKGTITILGADGVTTRIAVAGDKLLAGETIVSDDPNAVLSVQYIDLDQPSTYAGVFDGILLNESVYAQADKSDSELNFDNLTDDGATDEPDTAAGEEDTENNPTTPENDRTNQDNNSELQGVGESGENNNGNDNDNGNGNEFKQPREFTKEDSEVSANTQPEVSAINANNPNNGGSNLITSTGTTTQETTGTGSDTVVVGTGTVRVIGASEGAFDGGGEDYYDYYGGEDVNLVVSTIDQWSFTHNGGALTIDILTEIGRDDINNDNTINPFDSQIILFVKNEDGEYEYYDGNDDASSPDGTNDGSTTSLDSYLSYDDLEEGEYMVGVGELSYGQDQALQGYSTNDYSSFGSGPYQITLSGDISDVVATTVDYNYDTSAYIGVNTTGSWNSEYNDAENDSANAQSFLAQSDVLHSIELGIYQEEDDYDGDYEENIVTVEIKEILSTEEIEGANSYYGEATDTVIYGDTIYTQEDINLSGSGGGLLTLNNLNLSLEVGSSYAIVVTSTSGFYYWGNTSEYVNDYFNYDIVNADDNQGAISGNELRDGKDFAVRISFADSQIQIFESTDTVLTTHDGSVATATDADVDDTHTYALVDDSITSTDESVTDLEVTIDENGDYTLSGNFNALGEGEEATVTFDYYATDDSGEANAQSEPATVSVTVTGTDDAAVITQDGSTLSIYDVDGGSVRLHEIDLDDDITHIELSGDVEVSVTIYDLLYDTEDQELIISSDDGDASDQVNVNPWSPRSPLNVTTQEGENGEGTQVVITIEEVGYFPT